MNLAELQKDIHTIAKERNCSDPDETIGDMVAEVHLELSKAFESYLNEEWIPGLETGNEIDTRVEGALANVIIQTVQMAELCQAEPEFTFDLTEEVDNTGPPDFHDIMDIETFGDWISAAHWQLANVMAKYKNARPVALLMYLPSFVRFIYVMADHYGIDLDVAIKATMECYKQNRDQYELS